MQWPRPIDSLNGLIFPSEPPNSNGEWDSPPSDLDSSPEPQQQQQYVKPAGWGQNDTTSYHCQVQPFFQKPEQVPAYQQHILKSPQQSVADSPSSLDNQLDLEKDSYEQEIVTEYFCPLCEFHSLSAMDYQMHELFRHHLGYPN
jgi:hypothetical protein